MGGRTQVRGAVTPTTDLKDVPVCVTMVMMNTGFEEVPQTADNAIRVWGCGLDELFASAAVGMAHVLVEVTDGGQALSRLLRWLGMILRHCWWRF